MKISKLKRHDMRCNTCNKEVQKGNWKYDSPNGAITCKSCRCGGNELLYWAFARVKTINGGFSLA